ncbi:phage tail spike protein [Bacillus cereus group sp. MYBK30-1]|uniref:phage tail spike protein n=1 Tax=unclassified Bacillus cereus group TaxID=2750818 RepID=UPI003F78C417
MRTPSGILHVVDFKTSQIVSNIQPKDYWDDKRHWEIKNNVDTLEFKVFDNTDHAATLMQQNLVLKEVRDGRIVPYVITETEKNSDDRSIIAYASGEWIQLAKAGIINPQKIEGKTVNEFIDMALVGTKWKRGKTEYAGFHTMTIDEFIDPLKFLKDIASLFELETQYRAEVVGSQIVIRYVDMVKKRGRDTGKEVTLGKDLMGIKRVENSQNICTALVGFVKKEGGDFITISSINNGVPYLVDNDAFQRWNERGQHKFGFYTPETEEDITPQRLLTLMKTELAKRVNTSYSYDVQAQSIGRVFGLTHELINEGDTIRIKDTGFTPKLYLEARAIAGDESFTDPSQDKYVFGDYREIVDANEELRKLYNKIRGMLNDKANKELVDQLEELANKAQETANNSKQTADDASAAAKAAKDIADAVLQKQKDFQTKIIKSKTPPENPIKDLTLWLDITDPAKPILYLWNGTKWERLTPDTSILDDDIKGIEDEIKKLQTEVGSKVNQQWVKEQIQTDIKNKADIKDVYKKTEINQALEGHVKVQSYEVDKKALQADIANNKNKINENDNSYIKRFTENESKITQTEKDIKTQIEQLSVTNKKVDSQGNTIDAVQKKTNEIIQDANGTKQTITEIQTTMENQLATSRNVLDNSDFEADLEGWKVMGGANVKVTVGKFAEGNNAEMPGFNKYIKIERTGDIWIYRDLQMPLGDGIISMWARAQTNDPKSVPALGVKDNADGATGDHSVKYFISNVPGEMRDGKWHQFHFNCKVEHGKVRVYFGQRQGTPVGSVVYLTDVKLAQGTVKDNWSKSPGDMTSNTEFTKKTAEIINSVDQVSSKLSKTEQNVTTVSNDVKKVQETADTASTAAKTADNKAVAAQNSANNANTAATNADKKAGLAQTAADNADKKAQEAQTQITATNKKVSEVAQTVDGLQVNISNVTKIQTQQGTDIKNAQTELQKQSSQIKANADAIATKVSAEYVQDYTGGLGINNKFRDADFSLASNKNLQYWEVNKGGDGNVEFLKGSGHEGFNSCRVTGRADSTQAHANFSHFFAAGEIVGEVDYVVSVYAFAEKAPASDKYASVHFNYHRSDGTQISQEGKQLNLAVGAHIKTDVPFKPPAGTVRTRIRFYAAGVGFVVRFSKPMVTNGKTGTTFTLNPKDYTDYDKLVDDIADRVLIEDYDKKMTEMNTQFTQTSKALELKAETKNVYIKNEVDSKDDAIVENMNSQFKIQSNEISSKVAKGSIISSINQTAEKITIDVSRLDINADTMVKWLTAKGIDTNIINVNGDKITIDKNGVTVKMLDFLFQDEWGTKTTAVSRRNLIADSDFSSVGKKNIGHGDYYGFEGGYGLPWKSQGNVVIEKNTAVFNYEQMVNAARVDMYNYPEAVVNNGIHPGNEYTLSAHFRTSLVNGVRKTAKPRLHVCCVKFRDSVSYDIWNEQKMDFPEPSTFYGEIRRYSFTFKVPTNYNPQEHALIIKVCSANGQISAGTAICVSGVTLYSGKYASMYNWDRAAAERAAGLQPFNSISVGGVNNNIGPAPDGQTFDISTENEVKFFRNIRAVQGVNLGGNAFQGWGHIRFTDGSRGVGFYVNNSNGWHFNALG